LGEREKRSLFNSDANFPQNQALCHHLFEYFKIIDSDKYEKRGKCQKLRVFALAFDFLGIQMGRHGRQKTEE